MGLAASTDLAREVIGGQMSFPLYDDQLRELCARIMAAQDLEEVEKAGTELRKLLRDQEQLHAKIHRPPQRPHCIEVTFAGRAD